MKADLSVPMLPHDADYFAALIPPTMVDVKIDKQEIEIVFNEDLEQDVKPLYARAVLVEFDKDRSLLDPCGLPGSPRLDRALHFVRQVGASGA